MKRGTVHIEKEDREEKDSHISSLKELFTLDVLGFDNQRELGVFVLILFTMMMSMIFVTHYAEKKKWQLNNLKKEVEELQWTHESREADLRNLKRRSEVMIRLKDTEIDELTEPVEVILYDPTDLGFD